MLQIAFGESCMNRASIFEWHKRFKEARESVGDDERGINVDIDISKLILPQMNLNLVFSFL